ARKRSSDTTNQQGGETVSIATTGELQPLSELIPGWDPSWPQTGIELYETPAGELAPLAAAVRRHLMAAQRSSEQLSFAGTNAVRDRIEAGHIKPKWKKWEMLVLDRHRYRVMRPDGQGGAIPMRWVTRRVPTLEEVDAR